jgi:hypothetical protein
MNLTKEEMRHLEELNRLAFDVDWKRLNEIHRGRFSLPAPLVINAAIVFLAVILGVLLGHLITSRIGAVVPPGELLIAGLTPAPGLARDGKIDRLEATLDGAYAIRSGSTYSLIISSPRSGEATLVLSGADQTVVYPAAGQGPILVDAGKPSRYGPLRAPRSRTTVLVVVTDPQATVTIRAILEKSSVTEVELLAPRIQDALRKAQGHWIAINQLIVEPSPAPRSDQTP